MDVPGRLTPLAGHRIGDADPDKKPTRFEFLYVAVSAYGFERTGEDRTDNLAERTRKYIGVHHSPTNAAPRPLMTGPDLWFPCSGGGARTHDLRINSPTLCQLSYPGMVTAKDTNRLPHATGKRLTLANPGPRVAAGPRQPPASFPA